MLANLQPPSRSRAILLIDASDRKLLRVNRVRRKHFARSIDAQIDASTGWTMRSRESYMHG
jgi:hypothetical protein